MSSDEPPEDGPAPDPNDFQEAPDPARREITEGLFRSHAGRLIRSLRRRVHAPEHVRQDLAQQVWERMLHKPSQPVRSQLRYFYGIVNNVIREHLYRKKRNRETPESSLRHEETDEPTSVIDDASDRVSTPESLAIGDDIERLLYEAVLKLDPPHRAVFLAREIDRLSTRETAAQLGVSDSTVERYLADARTSIWDHLTAREKDLQ